MVWRVMEDAVGPNIGCSPMTCAFDSSIAATGATLSEVKSQSSLLFCEKRCDLPITCTVSRMGESKTSTRSQDSAIGSVTWLCGPRRGPRSLPAQRPGQKLGRSFRSRRRLLPSCSLSRIVSLTGHAKVPAAFQRTAKDPDRAGSRPRLRSRRELPAVSLCVLEDEARLCAAGFCFRPSTRSRACALFGPAHDCGPGHASAARHGTCPPMGEIREYAVFPSGSRMYVCTAPVFTRNGRASTLRIFQRLGMDEEHG